MRLDWKLALSPEEALKRLADVLGTVTHQSKHDHLLVGAVSGNRFSVQVRYALKGHVSHAVGTIEADGPWSRLRARVGLRPFWIAIIAGMMAVMSLSLPLTGNEVTWLGAVVIAVVTASGILGLTHLTERSMHRLLEVTLHEVFHDAVRGCVTGCEMPPNASLTGVRIQRNQKA